MLVIRNVPVVIEPGVAVLETEFAAKSKKDDVRIVPVPLQRIVLDEKTLPDLPFIPTTSEPHVFAPTQDVKKAHTLVVYDFLGRLTAVYMREGPSWEKHPIAEEHAGQAVTQFSVRFCFGTAKSRDRFMSAVSHVLASRLAGQQPDAKAVEDVFQMLERLRVDPIVLPVAAHKKDLKNLKL
jgi:hypothetical protein